MVSTQLSVLSSVALLALVGCQSEPESVAIEPAEAAEESSPDLAAATGSAHGTTGADLESRTGTPLSFTAPDGWPEETPASSMRVAQYVLPTPGDDDDGSLIVYHFGAGGAGSIQANIDRWVGQFETDEEPQIISGTVDGMPLTRLEIAGTYVAQLTPGSDERHHQPGWRMIAAIIESDHGPYFVKAIGPEATVDHWRDDVDAFVASARR